MSLTKKWQSVDGVDLLDALAEKNLRQLVPESSGVYLWKRRIYAPSGGRLTAEECTRWLNALAYQPAAKISRRSISHCFSTDGLTVGGGGLTNEKKNTLSKAVKNKQVRQKLIQFGESLSQFMPVIYFGETNNLYVRVRSHLDGSTGLKEYVNELLGLDLYDLEFRFLVLSDRSETSDETKQFQELLEMLGQRMLAPFATERPG